MIIRKYYLLGSLIISFFNLSNAQFYSQCGQDEFIYNSFFKNKKTPGIFIDIGAHNGITYSNTYFFEKDLKWTGICIEPLPHIFTELEKNRNCICINGCIANKTGELPFLSVETTNQRYGEMLSGLINNYDPRHLERIKKEISMYGGKTSTINVPCYRLNDILELYQIYYIDLLSIDTEGNELDIIQSIDFNRFYIDVITIENNYNMSNIRSFLEHKGFHLKGKLSSDEIYQNQYNR